MLDATGYDIGPLIEDAAAETGLSAVLILAMLRAESGLDPFAVREGVPPDVSAGLAQMTLATASGYGIGDGTYTPQNWANVKQALFDRETSIRMGAQHLLGCWLVAERYADRALQALIAFNSGSPQDEGNWYWQRWGANIANYRAALEWAKAQVGQ